MNFNKCMPLCILSPYWDTEPFHHPGEFPYALSSHNPKSNHHSEVFPPKQFEWNNNVHSCESTHSSFSFRILRFIHVVVYNSVTFILLLSNILTHHNLFTYSPVNGHLGCFQCLPLQTKLLLIFLCKYDCRLLFSFLSCKYLRARVLGHRICMIITFTSQVIVGIRRNDVRKHLA